MDFDFSGKVAIVTGAGSGIGKATAYAFAEHGAVVAIVDINTEKGPTVSRDLEERGYKTLFVKTDVAYQDQTNEMIETVLKTYGRIDILVNNAGIEFNDRGNLITMPYDDMLRILNVNLLGYIHCARSAVPDMIKRGEGGKIVNISSAQGHGAHLPGTTYQVSKSGILGLTRALAVELAPYKINVNTLSPGAISTEGMGKIDKTRGEGIIDEYRRMIPWGSRGYPDDIAYPVLFLCSPYAGYITGENLTVDGGWLTNITPDKFMPDPHSHPVLPKDPDK